MLNIVKIQNGVRFNGIDWAFTYSDRFPNGYDITSETQVYVCLNNNTIFFDCAESKIDGIQYETAQEFIDAMYA